MREGREERDGRDTRSGSAHAGRYEIRLGGHLDARWAAWFDGLSLTHAADGTTSLCGPVVDQAALHGLLQKVRDLGAPLLSVTRLGPDRHQCPSPEQRDPLSPPPAGGDRR